MSKHTPGPFKVVECDGNFEIRTMDGKCLADAWSYGINSNAEEMEANANLFAAAPDLLEALIDVRRALELANFTGELAVVDAAIARAKGESA